MTLEEKPDFNDWIKSKEGGECMQWPVSSPEYLHNRLFWAFDAGRDCVWSQFIALKKRNSEMQSVMEDMKKVIESNISDYKLMAGLEPDDGVVAALEGNILNMKQALSKYNELFKK